MEEVKENFSKVDLKEESSWSSRELLFDYFFTNFYVLSLCYAS